MNPFFGLIIGLFVTMGIIPPFVRASGNLRLQDKPNARKIHTQPIPCVGGFGIVGGVLLAILVSLPLESYILSYLMAAFLVFAFGILDDRQDLNYKWKLVLQTIPIAIVLHGGILIDHLPFYGFDSIGPWLSYPITALFLLGLINAVNLFDGLDGLAGGCMLLSFGAIAVLAYQVDGLALAYIALSAMGAILGFLYFNTHPARVFLGDAGSQFLGFTVGILMILLVEKTHAALNPALPLLLLGLPLLDTTWVIILRMSQGRSPFVGDRQHLHHQLLNFGFTQRSAVSLIYLAQALMVGSGILLTYHSGLTVVGTFLAECGLIAGLVYWARAAGWKRPASSPHSGSGAIQDVRHSRFSNVWAASTLGIEIGISVFLIFGALAWGRLEQGLSNLALALAALTLISPIILGKQIQLFIRIAVYVAGLLALFALQPLAESSTSLQWAMNSFFVVLALAVAGVIRFTRRDLFQVTPQDLLVAFFALAVPNLPPEWFGEFAVGYIFPRAVVVFYACEYLVTLPEHKYAWLKASAIICLLLFGARGWLP